MQVGDIAARIGCVVEGNPEVDVLGIAPVDQAGPSDLAFVANPRYHSKVASSRAGALILSPGVESKAPAVLRTENPYLAFARALELFAEPEEWPPGAHETAIVDPSATIGRGASLGPYVVIGAGALVGEGARLGPHVVLGRNVRVGDRFLARARVVVGDRVEIGDDVVLESGVVLGSAGFGYVPEENGSIRKLREVGNVVLEDGVEIGANSTVDRATIGSTRIRRGAKIDNLVQIAHGCDIGEFAFLAAQVGLAGSTIIGSGAQLGGQVGAAGHLTIGAGARVGAQGGVASDVPSGTTVMGYPTMEIGLWRRYIASRRRLPELLRRVRDLERSTEK